MCTSKSRCLEPQPSQGKLPGGPAFISSRAVLPECAPSSRARLALGDTRQPLWPCRNCEAARYNDCSAPHPSHAVRPAVPTPRPHPCNALRVCRCPATPSPLGLPAPGRPPPSNFSPCLPDSDALFLFAVPSFLPRLLLALPTGPTSFAGCDRAGTPPGPGSRGIHARARETRVDGHATPVLTLQR